MVNKQSALQAAAELCKKFEGFYSKPYLCPANVPTIGYGSTLYEDGVKVTLKDPPVTKEYATKLLMLTLSRDYFPAVLKLCPNIPTDGSLTALTDFTYNLGVGALRSSSIRRAMNNNDLEGVRQGLLKYVYGGGKVLPGLVKRRKAEVSLV